eukprot:9485267-Pyramimonas_sp.AAC.1
MLRISCIRQCDVSVDARWMNVVMMLMMFFHALLGHLALAATVKEKGLLMAACLSMRHNWERYGD